MKKYLKTTIVVLGLGVLCLLGYKVIAKMQYKTRVAENLQQIPVFSFQTLDNTPFTQNDIDPDKATVFIYFNSHCDYCQHEAAAIQSHIKQFIHTQFIFVSDEDPSTIREFAKHYKLDTYDYITFLSDPQDDFTTRFDATSVPYLLIYDKEQHLLKRHKGQLAVDTLVSALEL